MKQYLGLIPDHSGSMRGLTHKAMQDYNSLIKSFKAAATRDNIDTIVSVTQCGIGPGRGRVVRTVINSNVQVLEPLNHYPADGSSTPLFNAVGDLITQFKAVPDYKNPDVSFLVMATTDGGDNDSDLWRLRIAQEIKELQATDKWTFVFRVPKGYKRELTRYGIPEHNIHEWEQTEQGFEAATQVTASAVDEFYSLRKSGAGASRSFYSTNLSGVARTDVKKELVNISKESSVYLNSVRDGISIKDLSTYYTKGYVKGTVFYQLMKRESDVQDYKIFCIRHKKTGVIYSGEAARDLLNLPHHGTIAINPGNHGEYDIFIQSTAYNRKIPLNSSILVWNKVRKM
jgi:hypothetical protein